MTIARSAGDIQVALFVLDRSGKQKKVLATRHLLRRGDVAPRISELAERVEVTSAPVIRRIYIPGLAAGDEQGCGIDRVAIAPQVAEADHAAEQRPIVIRAELQGLLVEPQRFGVVADELVIRGGQ